MFACPFEQLLDAAELRSKHTALFVFARTRSQLVDASFPDDKLPKPQVVPGPGFSAVVVRQVSRDQVAQMQLKVIGEPMDLLDVIYFEEEQDWQKLMFLASRGATEARAEMAEQEKQAGDGRQMFFHHLDYNTNRQLLAYREFPGRDARIQMVTQVIGALYKRLCDRYCDAPIMSSLPNCPNVNQIHDIFVEASLNLRQDDPKQRLGLVMLDFAAGELEKVVEFQIGPRRYRETVTRPDSYFVFLFAELAIAAIELQIEPKFWLALLPELVKMQDYYLSRFGGRRDLDQYKGEVPRLAASKRSEIDRMFPNGGDRSTMERQIQVHLDQTSRSHRDRERLCGEDRS